MLFLVCDLLNRGVYPSRGGFGILRDFRTQRSRQPRSDLGNDFGRDALLSEGLERMNDQAALPKIETRLLQGSVFEHKAGTADFVVSVRTIG